MTTTAENERLDPALIKLAAILLTGVMVVMFDSTIVNVALETLARALHAPVSTTQWVVSAYVLSLGMVIPVSSWAMQRFGAKQMWLGSLALFTAGSLLCSTAWNIDVLIAFRVLQGIGGGMMLPIMQTLMVEAAGGRKLGQIMAMLGLPALLGPILGPVLGGLVIHYLSWHWIFWINVPLGVLGLLLAWRGLPLSPPRPGARLDVVGLALLSPALATIIYGLTEAGSRGGFGQDSVVIPLLAGGALLVVFVLYTLRTTLPPVVDLRLFRVPSFTASAVLLFLSGLALYGALLLLPLYYQQVRGQDALAAGILLAPQGLGMLCTRAQAGKLTDRIGGRPVVLGGFLLTLLGTLAFTQVGVATNELWLCLSLVVRGAGLGAVFVPIMATAYLGLRPDQIADASSATRILQQVGGSFGAAVFAMILQSQLTAHHAITLAGQVTAFDNAFWWSVGFTALAIVPALALPGAMRLSLRAEKKAGTAA